MTSDQVWPAVLGELELQMTQATFDTWLRDTRLLKRENGLYVIGVKSGYAKDWLENRLLGTIKRTMARHIGKTVEIKFVVWDKTLQQKDDLPLLNQPGPAPSPSSPDPASRPTPTPLPTPTNLNPRYMFDNFVVGPGNRLAHAASIAITETPGGAYNPFFIYGGVGLGKTHLLNAIGHICCAQSLRVLYISSEKFTNDLIEAIRTHTTEAFRDKYRTVDVLLIDDIQFIAGKESTQEEFFHTFNTLHSNGKQIVISSDRAPKAMSTLEERLRSRFEWGLIADIQSPEWETRIAILRSKAEAYGVPIPDGILELIASRIQCNIRELEGALNKVLAMAQLIDQPLTEEVAEKALINLMPQETHLTPDQILGQVAHYFGLEVAALRGRSRSRAIARPRQIAMYLIREETGESLPHIGKMLGGRDHTTVLYGCERINELMEQDSDIRRKVVTLRQHIYDTT